MALSENLVEIEGKIWPLHPRASILFKDQCGLMAFEKPIRVRTHPNEPGIDKGSLFLAEYDLNEECYIHHESKMKLWMVNRLDSPTSGVVLGVFKEDLLEEIRKIFKKHSVHKVYYAVVKGVVQPGVWRDKLEKHSHSKGVRSFVGKGVYAETEVFEILRGKTCSLIRLEPKTGRTHQLRVQCTMRGNPILGDKTYGDFKFNKILPNTYKERLFLHSALFSLEYAFDGGKNRFEAQSPMPDCFKDILSL